MPQKTPKNPFLKYGHECTLLDLPKEFDYLEIPNTGCWNKFRRFIIRMCVVSESSKMYTHHLRSFGAIVKERRRQVLNYPGRIHPYSHAYLFWSLLMVVVIFLELFRYPIDYLLEDLTSSFIFSKPWQVFNYMLNFIFFLNVIICFCTGYYDEPRQEVVLDFKHISLRYLKTFLFVDLIACWSFHKPRLWFDVSPRVDFICKMVSCLEYLLIIRFYRYYRFSAEIFDFNYYTYMITLVVIFTLIFWHVVCCMMNYLRMQFSRRGDVNSLFRMSTTYEQGLVNEQMEAQDVMNRFISAFYRNSMIVYNSSYGRSLPSTEVEILLIWLGWYASSLFFIYVLAMIMEIMKGKTSATHKYVEMERQLKDYMRHKQLPMQMRNRILTYYEFRFQKSYFRENEILETISEQLRQEINMHACRKLVENVIFFRNLPLNLLVRIISCLRIEVYLVNDIIIRANTPGNSMYFISTGTVAIYTKSGKEICHLEDGAHFGEIALIIKGTLRTASVIAVEVSEIYRLDQKDFVKAINPYPDLLANIQHIAAERMEVASMLDDYNKKEQATKR